MNNKERNTREEQPRISCPICGNPMGETVDLREYGLDGPLVTPKAKDLTQCDRCDALLEYHRHSDSQLVLRRAPRGRIDRFNAFAQEGAQLPNLQELLEYRRRYN